MDHEEFLDELRDRLWAAQTALADGHTLHVLLLGTASEISHESAPRPVTPDRLPVFEWSGEFPTDAPYADLDDDGLPELALGRVPATTVAEAEGALAKTIQYESGSEPGEWRHRLVIFASEGKFGPILDGLLEKVGFGLAEHIPYEWEITFLHARKHSPYALPPSRYSERLLDQLNQGALLAVYLGHGYPDALERVDWGRGDRGPILDLETIKRIRCRNQCPILVLVACHTGRPAGGGGLAERIALLPWSPPAVLAATEVSHPYPNALLVSALNREILQLRRPTLGEAFRQALAGLLDSDGPGSRSVEDLASVMWDEDERKRLRESHLRLYALLGDPALRPALPAGRIEVTLTPESARPGETVGVCAAVQGPLSGRITLTLEAQRDEVIHELSDWEATPATPAEKEARDRIIEQNWRRANDKVLVEITRPYFRGRFSTWLEIPPSIPPGTYVIRASSNEGPVSSAGSAFITVEPPEDAAEPGLEHRVGLHPLR
jgi:hypothetical protein